LVAEGLKKPSISGTSSYSVVLDTTGAVNVTSTSARAQILVINTIVSASETCSDSSRGSVRGVGSGETGADREISLTTIPY
jgi:hypothetical protein